MSRSGDATLISGDHGFNEYAAATDPVVRGRVTGDAFDRVIVQAGGTILTGNGTIAPTAGSIDGSLLAANNLSDVLSAATSRANLNAASLAANSFTASQTLADAANLIVGSTTGTQIATATTQKIGFFGATPVVQVTGGTDVLASLVTLGLRAASANPPLNLGTGALTAGASTLAATTVTTLGTAGNVTLADTNNVVVGSTTGTQIATATTQKLGFFGTTPVVQPVGSADLGASLAALGLVGAITNPPLNLGTGALTAGTTSVGALTATSVAATGTVALTGTLTVTDAINVVLGSTTGTKIGTATTQKVGFYNATPVVQPAGSADLGASLAALGLVGAITNPPLNLGTGTLTAGTVSFSAKLSTLAQSAAANVILSAQVTGDNQDRFNVSAGGTLLWEPGTSGTGNGISIAGPGAGRSLTVAGIGGAATFSVSPGAITASQNVTGANGAATAVVIGTAGPGAASGISLQNAEAGCAIYRSAANTIQIGESASGSVNVGFSTAAKLALYGGTPRVQASAITAPAATASTNVTPFGYTTAAQADAVVTALRALLTATGATAGIGITA